MKRSLAAKTLVCTMPTEETQHSADSSLAWLSADPGTLTAAAAETVTVDLGADSGEILHRASGFLHGFSHDGQLPPDKMIAPLKVRLHRTRPGTTVRRPSG